MRSRSPADFLRKPKNRGSRRKAPSRRLSSTESGPKILRPSGEWASPSRAMREGGRPCTGFPSSVTLPLLGRTVPEMARIVVVLPAPFAPISATTVPALTVSEAPTSTSLRPYPACRSETTSTLDLRSNRLRCGAGFDLPEIRFDDLRMALHLRRRALGDGLAAVEDRD